MTKPITDAALAEIEAGLKALDAQKWAAETDPDEIGTDADIVDELNFVIASTSIRYAAHIARMNPDTVRAMIARIRAAEAERDKLKEALAAAKEADATACTGACKPVGFYDVLKAYQWHWKTQQPIGCICPPGANRDCERTDCPRKPQAKETEHDVG